MTAGSRLRRSSWEFSPSPASVYGSVLVIIVFHSPPCLLFLTSKTGEPSKSLFPFSSPSPSPSVMWPLPLALILCSSVQRCYTFEPLAPTPPLPSRSTSNDAPIPAPEELTDPPHPNVLPCTSPGAQGRGS